MWMAIRSNSGFRHEGSLSSMMSRHAINFQSNTSSEMSSYLGRNGVLSGMDMMINNAAASSGLIQTGNSSNPLDSVSVVKLDTCLASEWLNEEQYKLEDGLEKYKDKPSIMKYIKIAATLPEKTVRDVALRCRWMTRKRRKAEEYNCGKRINSSRDKQAESSSKSSIPSVLPDNMAPYPLLMPFTSSSKHITCEDLSGHAINLLDQNVKAFNQIRANLSSYKVADNLDLFRQTQNNLITIQNDMNNMPGLMSHMPPLPVRINDDLSATILSNLSLAMPFNTRQSGGFQMKQEPLG